MMLRDFFLRENHFLDKKILIPDSLESKRLALMEGDFSSFICFYFCKHPCKIIFKCQLFRNSI